MATRSSVNLEPAKGTTSYIVSSSSTSAKPKTKPAPIDTSRAQTMPSDKDKNPSTPRGIRHGHRRVDETGETTYKKKYLHVHYTRQDSFSMHSEVGTSAEIIPIILTPSSALMSAIQLGIGFTVGRLSAKPDRDVLMQDFAEVETVSFPSEGTRETPSHRFSDFKFKSYSPLAFRYFRDLFGMNPAEFMMALCNEPLVELTNSGASGSLFYVTNDDEFIVKTVQHKEAEFLQKLLPGYYLNLNQNKRTLLPKFFGLYCYQTLETLLVLLYSKLHSKPFELPTCGGKNIRLVIMNNLLPLEYKIHLKYDLKGSTYKRKASKGERAKGTPTLKDLDFITDHPEGLFLEQDTYNAVIKTIQRDCRVLQSFKIMDYSLLLAIHKVDELERDRPSLGDITAGVKLETLSGHPPPSPDDNYRTTSHVPQETTTGNNPEGTSLPIRPPLIRSRSLKGREGFSSAWEAITVEDRTEERPVGGIPARNAKGERLLLFLGIIDILQSYRIVKKLEHGWKALVHDGDTVSVHRPSFYSNRFQEFMTNHVFKKQPVKEKNSPRKRNPERGLNRVRSMTEHDRIRADSGERGRSRSFTESDKTVHDTTRVKRAATIATDHGTTAADKKVTVLDRKGGSSPGAEESDSPGTQSPSTVTQETVSKDTNFDYEKTNLNGISVVPQEITESALGTDTAEQPVSTAPIEQENTSNEVAIENEASNSEVIRPTSDNPSVDNLNLIENIMDMESSFREEAT